METSLRERINAKFLAAAIAVTIIGCSTVLTAIGRFPADWTRDIYFTVLGAVLGAFAARKYGS